MVMKRIRIFAVACCLVATGTAHAQEPKPEPKPPEKPREIVIPRILFQGANRLRGFSVVLLLGETQGNNVAEGLSAPARKALADIKDFLPYKGYLVLDTQWLASSSGLGSGKGRLHGIDNQDYEFQLEFQLPQGQRRF